MGELSKALAIGLAVGWLALGGVTSVQAETSADRCDALAASPNDSSVKPGSGVKFDDIDAKAAIAACLEAAAAAPEDPRQLFQLARAYDAGGDTEKAHATYTAAADKGYPLATAALGILYELGIGVAEDPVKAIAYYQTAADKGVPLAMEALAKMYEEGRGVAQDYGRAAALYQQAIDAGSTYASGALGWLTENGWGVTKDQVAARRLYQVAADAGEAFAQHNIGVMYATGSGGLAQNDAEALRYYTLAAKQNWGPAFISLGNVYGRGVGVPKDLSKAEDYFTMALASSEPGTKGDAQNDIAWLYATELGRLDEAEALARESVADGPEDANRLDTLAWVLHLAGKNAEALPIIEKAAALDASDTVIAEHLATIKAAN